MENQVLFYVMDANQHEAFVQYFEGKDPFTEYNGMYYISAAAADADGTLWNLLEFDEQDDVPGNDYTNYWWNISTIPSVLWP